MTKFQGHTLTPSLQNATQWFKNGDHPLDYSKPCYIFDNGEARESTPEERKAKDWEGGVVRRYRHPYMLGGLVCSHCGKPMHDHGWIDDATIYNVVCPGDWIIATPTGYMTCKPDLYEALKVYFYPDASSAQA